ncbi:uncharacterized protein VP01_191g12 [Puccinia sorghi]|uniref:Uncharacterized protein n=1 Tax=Puccinia sorghi TaxID=27349 RepID=A0A0L6VCM6_9BASI|nr:uncharacterized protein VP01_191g12 [Puccinia sorghi]
MVLFLQPLKDFTHFLSESDYPTLNISLPTHISLIKDIISMVFKLKNYLVIALKNPAPIYKMILDPCIKMKYFQKNLLRFQL